MSAAPTAAAAMAMVCRKTIAEYETRLVQLRTLLVAAEAVAGLPAPTDDFRPPDKTGLDVLVAAMAAAEDVPKNGKGEPK